MKNEHYREKLIALHKRFDQKEIPGQRNVASGGRLKTALGLAHYGYIYNHDVVGKTYLQEALWPANTENSFEKQFGLLRRRYPCGRMVATMTWEFLRSIEPDGMYIVSEDAQDLVIITQREIEKMEQEKMKIAENFTTAVVLQFSALFLAHQYSRELNLPLRAHIRNDRVLKMRKTIAAFNAKFTKINPELFERLQINIIGRKYQEFFQNQLAADKNEVDKSYQPFLETLFKVYQQETV